MNRKTSKRSIIPPMDGEAYTRFFSGTYDWLTTLSGWRKNLAAYALEGLLPPGNLLDIGCGTGYLLSMARDIGFTVHGVDPSSGMLEEAVKKYGFEKNQLIQAGAEKIPLPDASMDMITASGSLVYVTSIDRVAKEAARLLKTNGRLRIIDHADPIAPKWYTPFIALFSQISGDVLHDYPAIFGKHFDLVERKTLGRGGYLQRFDFVPKKPS